MAIYNSEICPVCNQKDENRLIEYIDANENLVKIPTSSMGAMDYTVYTLLRLIQREWEREFSDENIFDGMGEKEHPSQKLIIVILFWSLFEALMDKLFEHGMHNLSQAISKDLSKRYFSIGSRLDKLYTILFESKFGRDFSRVSNNNLYSTLLEIKNIRNEFIHGNPQVITDEIVAKVVYSLNPIQKAWIELYNLRISKKA